MDYESQEDEDINLFHELYAGISNMFEIAEDEHNVKQNTIKEHE